MEVEQFKQDFDWQAAFRVAWRDTGLGDYDPWDDPPPEKEDDPIEQVARVVATANGEADGDDWLGVFEMKDGRFAVVRAGCDYTGWG